MPTHAFKQKIGWGAMTNNNGLNKHPYRTDLVHGSTLHRPLVNITTYDPKHKSGMRHPCTKTHMKHKLGNKLQ